MNSAEEIVKDKKRETVFISHNETILKACQVMVKRRIGSSYPFRDN